MEQLDDILAAVSANLFDATAMSQGYADIYRFGKPFVSIQQFIEDDYYFGKIAKDLYPDNIPDLIDIFDKSKNYIEVILTGATSIGKTFMSCIAMSYIIGQVGSYKEPHKWIGGSSTSPIVFINMSVSAKKSKEVVFTRVKTMIDASPYFREKFKRDFKLFDSLTWRLSTEQGDAEQRLGSQMTFRPGTGDSLSALGEDIYAGIGDELNFFRVIERSSRTHGEALDPAQRLYDTISRRMKGRFSAGGLTLGKFFLLSSAQYPDDFIERRIREAEIDGSMGVTVKLIRKSIWEAKRKVFIQGRPIFAGKKFRVEVGTSRTNSRLLDEYNDKTGAVTPKAGLAAVEGEVIEVPAELYPDFFRDVEGSVRDFGGRVSRAIAPFFTDPSSVFEAETSELAHPWSKDETTLEDGSSLRLEILFAKDELTGKWQLVRHPDQMRFAAVDLGLTNDATGVSIAHLADWKQVSRSGLTQIAPVFETDLMLRVVAPQGGEVKMAAIRTLFFNLRNLGMNFGKITYDSFQSRDSIQLLAAKGFSVDVQSVDRELAPYNYLRDCFSEARMHIYHYEPLLREVPGLERRGDKVDHVPGSCFTGDTKVALIDGRSVDFRQLVAEHKEGKENWTYSISLQDKKIVPKRIINPRVAKVVREIVEVTLDNGEKIRCTPEHKFMLRTGSYAEAKDLVVDVSLMPLYRKLSEKGLLGYELLYCPFDNRQHFTHRYFFGPLPKGQVVHHRNFIKADNTPTNLAPMIRAVHQSLHSNVTVDYKKVAQALRDWNSDPRNMPAKLEKGRKISIAKTGRSTSLKGTVRPHKPDCGCVFCRSKRHEYIHREECSCASCLSKKHKTVFPEERRKNASSIMIQLHADHPEKWESSRQGMRQFNRSPEGRQMHREMAYRDLPNLRGKLPSAGVANHKVVSVEFLQGYFPVYDLTIADTENFALSAGVFVHNSKDILDSLAAAIWTCFNAVAKASPEEMAARLPYMRQTTTPLQAAQRNILNEEDEMRRWMNGSRRIVR